MAKLKNTCAQLFHPNQLGVAMPHGAEIGVHALRQYIRAQHREYKVVLQIDMKNTFNFLRRDMIRASLIYCREIHAVATTVA